LFHHQVSSQKSRHCAYCLKECPLVKLCGGCKKRAYCSRECQLIDWPAGGKGQGHKHWCRRYECGEEDVDWEIVAVPGKGLGIVAKRTIPAKYRIIVEGVYTNPLAHPGIPIINIFKFCIYSAFITSNFTFVQALKIWYQ